MLKTREAAESALRESEERFRAVIAALEEGIVLYEADGAISSCNASACRMLGLREEQILGRTSRNPAWRAVREDGSPFEPESHPATITLLTGLPCSRVVMGIERADGTLVWVSINSRPLRRRGEPDPYAVAVSFTDVTHLKSSEREMRWRADRQSVIADLARHALEGTPTPELMAEAVRRVADVLDLSRCGITDRMKLQLRAGTGWPEGDEFPKGADHPSACTFMIPGRHRSWGFLIAHPRPGGRLGSEEARFLESVATLLAVAAEREREQAARRRTESRQERLQHALRTSAQEWRLTFDAITHPLLLIDLDGRIVRLNLAARDLSGIDYDEAVFHHVSVLGNGQPWRAIRELLPQVNPAPADTAADDLAVQTRDDQGRTWDISMSPVTSPDDQKGAVVVARDITDLVRLQESLRRSETMSAMGALVAGVAHEVRNPLFGISATLDAFESRFGRRKNFPRYFDVLQGEVKRLSELMHQLLDYGKPARLDLAEVTPDEVMAMAATACEPLASRSGVDVAVESDGGLPQLQVDRGRIAQVFQNLLENAIQHSPKGKAVRFRAERVEGDRDGVRFAVEDAGPGFLPGDLHRVFEPFFTRRRGGTGLGLSIVQRIVEQHGGEVLAANLASGGAAMTVFLPLRPRRAGMAGPVGLAEMVRR